MKKSLVSVFLLIGFILVFAVGCKNDVVEETEIDTTVTEKIVAEESFPEYDNIYIRGFYSHFLRVDGTGDGAMEVYKYAENRLSPVSSIQYLPLVVIEDRQQLDRFTDGTKAHFNYDEYVKSAFEKYDDKYFEENSLFITYVGEGSGSVRHHVSRIYRENGNVRVFVAKESPEVNTWDMAGWLGFVEVKKQDIMGFENFDAVASEVSEYYEYQSVNEPSPSFVKLYTDGFFHFSYSVLSSNYIVGEYEWAWSEEDSCELLYLHTDDGNKYVFKRNAEMNLEFCEESSFPIESFKYSLASDPVPAISDGAVFEIKPFLVHE